MALSGGLSYNSGAGRWVIVATVLGSGMAMIDSTVVGIALPTIGRNFTAPIGTLQWVVTGYTLSLAALLLLGGSLGDRFGRRRVFCVGVVWFAVSSAACGLAVDSTFLVVARVVQGIGGALLTPGSLAILQASFSPTDRGSAIGAWSGLGGLAAAAGPLLGGYRDLRGVVEVDLLHQPPDRRRGPGDLGKARARVSAIRTPPWRHRRGGRGLGHVGARRVDLRADRGPDAGLLLAHRAGGPGGGGIAGGGAFLLVERARAAVPMLPLGLFGSRQFSVTNAVTLIVYAALGGALFLLPVELQVVNHYSPFEAGASLIPLTVVMLAFSARSGRLGRGIGPRLQMGAGPIVVGVGMALFIRSTSASSYLTGVLPGVLVFALGLTTTVAPLTMTALGTAPAENAGIASAVNNYVARVGTCWPWRCSRPWRESPGRVKRARLRPLGGLPQGDDHHRLHVRAGRPSRRPRHPQPFWRTPGKAPRPQRHREHRGQPRGTAARDMSGVGPRCADHGRERVSPPRPRAAAPRRRWGVPLARSTPMEVIVANSTARPSHCVPERVVPNTR